MTLTELDMDQIRKIVKEEVKDQLTSFRDQIMRGLDKVMGKLNNIDESLEILAPKVSSQEDRLEKLEELHPDGRHLSS